MAPWHSRRPELLLICLAFLVAYGVHHGLSPDTWHGTGRRRWNETRQFLKLESTSSTTSKTEGTTQDAPGTSSTWATTVPGHAGSMGRPTELGQLSARLQSFLEPILHPQGRWVQVAGDWTWKDANMRQWNLRSALFVEFFSKNRHIQHICNLFRLFP